MMISIIMIKVDYDHVSVLCLSRANSSEEPMHTPLTSFIQQDSKKDYEGAVRTSRLVLERCFHIIICDPDHGPAVVIVYKSQPTRNISAQYDSTSGYLVNLADTPPLM